MQRTARAISYLSTAAVSLMVMAFTFLAVWTWAAMYLPDGNSLAIAGAATFLPGFLVNKGLTRSYRRIDDGASEWGSIFGVLLMGNLILAPVLGLGIAGTAARIATHDAFTRAAAFTGFAEQIDEATLETFPSSDVDAGVIWVHNVGTTERPRVIARDEGCELRVVTLPPRGKVLEARTQAMVGQVDEATDRVMLCPFPEEGRSLRVENQWDGGRAVFEIGPHTRSATFYDG